MKRLLILICVVCLLSAHALASSGYGADFLLIDPSARTAGMGSCFTGIADDVSSLYWNPAGLNSIRDNEVLLSRNQWLVDTSYDYFGYAEKLERIGTLGLGLALLNYGTINGREADGYTTNTFSAYDSAVTLSYANDMRFLGSFGRGITFGISLKIIRQMLGDFTAHGLAFDLGLIYRFNILKDLTLGLAVRNLGTEMKFVNDAYPLPMIASFGGSCRLLSNLTTAVDLQYHKYSNDLKLNVGVEYCPLIRNRIFILRGGYQTYLSNNNGLLSGSNSVSDFTLGAGFRMGDYQFDYAFVPFKDFGQVHRISFLWKCDEPVLRSWFEKIFGGVAALNKFIFTKVVEGIGFLGKATNMMGKGDKSIVDADEIGEIPKIELDEVLQGKK